MTNGPGDGPTPHVFVPAVEHPTLGDDDRHHLERALRLRDGDEVTVSDGRGTWRRCRFGASLEPSGPIERTPRPVPQLTVGFALTKGSKPELVVQKLTELGIDVIVPFVAKRSVVRWDDSKAAKQHDRFTRIAREAAMQSRRTWLPAVRPLVTFDSFSSPAVRADREGAPLGPDHTEVLIGPEGGWSQHERDRLDSVHLGPHVLRAETAAIAAAALMGAWRERRPRV